MTQVLAVTLPDRVLLARSTDHPTELMTLRGARLGLMEEFPEPGHLNVKRLKDLLGTGEMSARYCGTDSVTWKPSHTPFVTTNYLPRVDESDDGTWRRLVLLDFPYRYRQAHEASQTHSTVWETRTCASGCGTAGTASARRCWRG
jgi:putative DNA primase/helicase